MVVVGSMCPFALIAFAGRGDGCLQCCLVCICLSGGVGVDVVGVGCLHCWGVGLAGVVEAVVLLAAGSDVAVAVVAGSLG